MDVNKFNTQLRNAVDTGKVIYGTKETIRECLVGDPKLIIVSKTIKSILKKQLEYYAKLLNVTLIDYYESGSELGSVCGKPYSISVVTVRDFGQSSIVDVINDKDANVTKKNSRVEAKAAKKTKKEEVKVEKVKAKKLKELKKKEEEEKPIKEDETLKNIIKIKKK